MKIAEDSVERAVNFRKKVDDLERKVRERLSPAGAFKHVTPLLDKRRLEYGIPDGAFRHAASFDRILVYQIAESEKETYGDTSIIMPEVVAAKKKNEAPRGILVSAGMESLDTLRSNGIDLGHVITFIRNAPWRIYVDNIGGHDFALLILRAGDIIGSEDLASSMAAGECSIETRETEHGDGVVVREHFYIDGDGKTWNPTKPFIGDDF